MYRSNRSFNTRRPPPHPRPGQPPRSLTFSKIIVKIPPYLSQNAVQMPHIRIHSGDSFHRHVNDKRTAETPSIVEQNLYKYRKIIRIQYNKNWEALPAFYYEQKSCAKRRKSLLQGHWMLSFSSCVMQHTKRSDMHHCSPYWLTYMRQVKVIDLWWPFYCCGLLDRRYRYCISL